MLWNLCMCVHVCMFTCVQLFMCTCGVQRSSWDVFFQTLPTSFGTGSSIYVELIKQARLASEFSRYLPTSSSFALKLQVTSLTNLICVHAGDLNLDPQDCIMNFTMNISPVWELFLKS